MASFYIASRKWNVCQRKKSLLLAQNTDDQNFVLQPGGTRGNTGWFSSQKHNLKIMLFLLKFIVSFSLSRIKLFWNGYKSWFPLEKGLVKIHGYDDETGHYLKRTNFSSLTMKQETMQQNSPRVGNRKLFWASTEPNKPQPLPQSGAHTPSMTTPVQAQQSPAEAAREKQSCQAVRELQRRCNGDALGLPRSSFNKTMLVILLNKCWLRSAVPDSVRTQVIHTCGHRGTDSKAVLLSLMLLIKGN